MDKQRADDILNHKVEATPTERTIATVWMEGYKTKEAELVDISICEKGCFCMTKTIKGKCGKCGAKKKK